MFRRVAVVASTVLLAACGTAQPVSVSDGTDTAPPAAAVATASAAAARLGQTYTYESGLKVTVSKAGVGEVAQYAAGADPGTPMATFTVTITNGTAATYDASLSTVTVAYGGDGVQAEQVYDMERGYGVGFTTKILPGRKATAEYGFGVPVGGLKDLVVEVSPGFLDHESVLFTGAAV